LSNAFQGHVSDFLSKAKAMVAGSRCVMNRIAAWNSSTVWVVSRGLLDKHSALPRLYHASAVSLCLFPDVLICIGNSMLKNSISAWALATTLS